MLGRFLTSIAVVASLLVAAPPPASAVGLATPLVSATATNSPFSPNHDGVKDRGYLSYRLAHRAFVTVRVSRAGHPVLTRSFGRTPAGAHTFVWDGTVRGRVVADGAYAVSVLARRTRHGQARVVSRALTVDARYGTLGIGADTGPTSSVVYPRTTVIHDVVVGLYQTLRPTRDPATIRLQVLSASGRVIDSDPLQPCSTTCSRYSWDGRDATGSPVAVGRYRLRLVQGRDRSGNPRVLVYPRTVTVSSRRLVARTTKFSAAAAAIIRRDPCAYGPIDCPSIRGQRSDRFVDGISYRSREMTLPGSSTPEVAPAYDIYFVPVAGRRTPYDTFTVIAHGGPTTQGAADTGTLSAGVRQDLTGTSAPDPVVQMHGDTTGTLRDVPSLGMFDPYDGYGGQGYGPVWNFRTSLGNQYDVASFEVSYTRYVPAG